MSNVGNVTLTMDDATVRRMLEGQGETVDRYVEGKAKQTKVVGKALAPRASGALGDSIEEERHSSRPSAWVVAANVEYAAAVHGGSRPHLIAPKGKVLRFPGGGGRVVYTNKPVSHPGAAAQPFLTDALRQVFG